MSTLHAPQRTSAVVAALQHPTLTDHAVRQTALDRLAMRLAVALLLWSTRPRADHSELELRRRARLERAEREAKWERDRALLAPRR